MKNTILFFFLLLAAAVSAQSNSFVTDRLRASEYFRIGTNTSQKVTGFDRVITAPGTHDSLPTSRAVVDFLEANFTPIGYYTAGDGISISDDVITNSAPDQVVGLTGGGISVITGTYPNFTITSNEVDGSTTNELQNLSLSGQSLSISSGTGVTLPVVGVTAGTGIGVISSGGTFTVSNTGDLSNTNEIQTLSLSGSDLTLSDGGGTVTLPADGNGIYGGSGTVPGGTNATLDGDFRIGKTPYMFYAERGYNENVEDSLTQVGIRYSGAKFELFKLDSEEQIICVLENTSGSNTSLVQVIPEGFQMTSGDENGLVALSVSANYGARYTDYTPVKLGIQYAAEYPDILTNDRSIPDVGWTKQIVASENGALGTGFTGGGGSGTIPGSTNAEVTSLSFNRTDNDGITTQLEIGDFVDEFTSGTFSGFKRQDGNGRKIQMGVNNDGGDIGGIISAIDEANNFQQSVFGVNPSLFQFGHIDAAGQITSFLMGDDGPKITDGRTLKKGLIYAGDYSAGLKTNDRSLPDVGTVNILKQTPVSYTNAAAPNNTIFYSTTDGKLSYKDPGGTVHGLY